MEVWRYLPVLPYGTVLPYTTSTLVHTYVTYQSIARLITGACSNHHPNVTLVFDNMDDSHPEAQVPYEFSFIKLTEFLDPGVGQDGAANGLRTSGASDRSVENASSAELEVELAHYKACMSLVFPL